MRNTTPSARRGFSTERMKRYMAFSSEHGIDSVLAEGWNKGWSSSG